MLVRLHADAHRFPSLEAIRDMGRGDARACPTMRFVTDGCDEEMRFVAHFLARGSDGIGPRRERPRERLQLLRRERSRKGLEEVNELPPFDPRARAAFVDE